MSAKKAKVSVAEPALLVWVNSLELPATKKFVAKEFFVVDTSSTAPVRICHVDEELLDKVEEPQPACVMRADVLKERSLNGPIIQYLDGDMGAETMISQVARLMRIHSIGESGGLLSSRRLNMFYIFLGNGRTLRPVSLYWNKDLWGWDVRVGSVNSKSLWDQGTYVLYPDL